jgi:transcriptional regulator with XRE-family HTH domain
MQAKMINHIVYSYYFGDMKKGRPAKNQKSEFAKRLQFLREDAKLSQRDVASALGISQPSYAAWERRDIGLTPAQLQKLAKILGVDTSDFFTNGDQPKRQGPVGRSRKTFESISNLPRSRQKQILDVIDILMAKENDEKTKTNGHTKSE